VADLHIDDFYRDTARILLRLYGQFPRPQMVFAEEICGSAEPDEFGLPGPRHAACFSTLVWLAEQGYLRFEALIRREGLDQAVLTEKGFLLLASRVEELPWLEIAADDGLPPSLLETSHSNVSQLRNALASGSSILLQRTVHHLLASAAR
jgi:hypothetical protein